MSTPHERACAGVRARVVDVDEVVARADGEALVVRREAHDLIRVSDSRTASYTFVVDT